jgi:hypothetical protein
MSLRIVSYRDAEDLSQSLAARLLDRLGDPVREAHFVALPRGGLIVLGMLSYVLGVERSRLDGGAGGDLTVVVDDCSLTGARFGTYLESLDATRVVFAHLLSHPELRAAIEEAEPRVEACVAAADLASPARPPGDEEAYRRRWAERLGDRRYWTGAVEAVAFAWSEPDRLLWNPAEGALEGGWHLATPADCLASSLALGLAPGDAAEGGWAPGPGVAWRVNGERVELLRLEDGRLFSLGDVETAMLRAVLTRPSLDAAAAEVVRDFEVAAERAGADLAGFVEDLEEQALLRRR